MNMRRLSNFLLVSCCGTVLLTNCVPASRAAAPTYIPPIPTSTPIKIFPTPATPGDPVTWRDLQVHMLQAEISESFITEFGAQREPSPGQKFLWVQVQVKNMDEKEKDLPAPEHFSVIYAKSELKPAYGHRQDYADYTALNSVLYPDQEVEAWLRFDIPVAAELNDLLFVFLPESSFVGASSSSPNYPWGSEHPTYVWVCGR